MPTQSGGASYYDLPHKHMANGHMFNGKAMTAAMLHVPLGTLVEARSIAAGRSISVTVTDRGPYVGGRIIDLTNTAYQALAGGLGNGVTQVEAIVP